MNSLHITKTYKAIELWIVAALTDCRHRRPACRAFFIALSDAFFDASLTKSMSAVWNDDCFFIVIAAYRTLEFFINYFMKRLFDGF